MPKPIILASASEIRAQLLRNARIQFSIVPARIDEDAIKAGLAQEEASPRDVADVLAEFKAQAISRKRPEALVIGCDQVAELRGKILSKPTDQANALHQLSTLSGKTHKLLSAVVIHEAGRPIWRHVGVVRLTARKFSTRYLEDYVARNWESIRYSVGAYKLEEEGIRLFSKIEGDYFTVLGLPMTELLSYLVERELIPV
ncbi:MAG: septum formation protein Maf [Rhodobacterales bacterium]|nr:MAG: septum formation protein Maf [Rhodobacterales bacterium]